MKLLRSKTPWLAKKAFPSYVWNFSDQEKVIYFTFDDGPTPIITNKVLAILAKYNAKATFFCIGKNIDEHQAIYRQILNEGHAIGNHTYNHLKGWKVPSKDYIENILKTDVLINSIERQKSKPKSTTKTQKTNHEINESRNTQKLFRPPYGRLKPSQGKLLEKLGYKVVMWDVLAIDWNKSVSKERVLQNIVTNTEKGSIVVLHDSLKAADNMLYALPKALDYFSKQGFEFRKIHY